MPATHTTTLRVPADHPSLAGHFPGRPIVPGVVLLDSALQEAAQAWPQPWTVTSLKQAKFLTPLLPLEDADLTVTLDHSALSFVIRRDDLVIAQGTFAIAMDAT